PPPTHQAGGIRAYIAETLDDYARLVPVHPEPFEGLVADDHQPTSRGLIAPFEPPNSSGFPCNDSCDGMANMHGVGIHNPSHNLLVGIDVCPGISFSGPRNSISSAVYRRVSRSSSPRDIWSGSQITPPA